MAVLPTNYLDDILAASMGGKRRFRITHEDGSTEEVTLEDVSEYEQVGSPFGSGDVNKTNQAVNEKLDSADVVDPALATVLGFAADAKLTGDSLSELNKKSETIVTDITNGSGKATFAKVGKICVVQVEVSLNSDSITCSLQIPKDFLPAKAFYTSALSYQNSETKIAYLYGYLSTRIITISGAIQGGNVSQLIAYFLQE